MCDCVCICFSHSLSLPALPEVLIRIPEYFRYQNTRWSKNFQAIEREREMESEHGAQIVCYEWNVNNWRLFQCLCCCCWVHAFFSSSFDSWMVFLVFWARECMHACTHAHINIVIMIFRVSFWEKIDCIRLQQQHWNEEEKIPPHYKMTFDKWRISLLLLLLFL